MADQGFVPDQGFVQQVLQVLVQCQSTNSQEMAASQEMLKQLNERPEVNIYLCHILVNEVSVGPNTRSMAAILLKNNVRWNIDKLSFPIVQYLKNEAVRALADPSQLVRKVAATLVSTLVVRLGLKHWPEAIPTLLHLMQNSDPNGLEGTLTALTFICEDDAPWLCEYEAGRLVDLIMKTVVLLFRHEDPSIRSKALQCSNVFVSFETPGFNANFQSYLQGVFALAPDTNPVVRMHVCTAMVSIVESKFEQAVPFLEPELGNITQYMLDCTRSEDEGVALEACEFWMVMADKPFSSQVLDPIMPQLLPLLLDRMQWSEFELATMSADDDADEEDRDEDVRPATHKAAVHGERRTRRDDGDGQEGAVGHDGEGGDEDEDDEDDDDDYDDEDGADEWSIRKCAAMTLDSFAVKYHTGLLPVLMPLLKQMFESNVWLAQEACMLALGAIADGCKDEMETYLPEILPFIAGFFEHEQHLVRSITCWCFRRYAEYICKTPAMLEATLGALTARLVDRNKKVQETACTALCHIQEIASNRLEPFTENLLRTYCYALDHFKRRNRLHLYDCISTMADAVGGALAEARYVNELVPRLLNQWQAMDDHCLDAFHITECLSVILGAVETEYLPYAEMTYAMAVNVLRVNIARSVAHQEGQDTEDPDDDMIVGALDLISSMVESLQGDMEPFISADLMELLLYGLQDELAEMRQSAFAVLGDLSKALFGVVLPHLDTVMLFISVNLTMEEPPVCNNAIWATGEIALHLGENMNKYVDDLLEPIIHILNTSELNTLTENAAITIGRLGLGCTLKVAQHLPNLLERWCRALRLVDDNDEKDSSFEGICLAVLANAHGALPRFMLLCDAISKFQQPSPKLAELFARLLAHFKTAAGGEWERFFAHFPELRQELMVKYNV
ncbi:uncharacterized protein MONBRDRAFT_17564 [Monosiga brevicollis MX1]|uniref:Importin N-terminal domain-containing protein n=1 Tax=Monosiga brevicollis TaxID=81824 RepID=A9US87_MONBE|nr:uncharacterized protein MONBRDRAFT_17564 [Monosiga brevicollis MX1]EDQ91738.1 predicted protein [Monosiga brevicollis MX1]|eukprot:XP_001743024.1 hypothetical protein [Monosiga brevicollis MX1]